MLRRVQLHHDGHSYEATVRNMSATGALIEGLWNVPEGTSFTVRLADNVLVQATARWCEDDRVGIEFASRVEIEEPLRLPGGAARAAAGPAPVQRRFG